LSSMPHSVWLRSNPARSPLRRNPPSGDHRVDGPTPAPLTAHGVAGLLQVTRLLPYADPACEEGAELRPGTRPRSSGSRSCSERSSSPSRWLRLLVIADVSERGVERLQALHPGTVARPPSLSPRHPLRADSRPCTGTPDLLEEAGRSTCWPTFGSCTVLRRTRLRREQARVVAEVVELGLLGSSARGSEIIG
jgi:hypothetical protein